MADPGVGARVPVLVAEAVRSEGLEVPVGSTVVLAEALACIDVARHDQVRAAARAVLVHGPADLDAFERAMARLDGRPVPRRPAAPPPPPSLALLDTDDADDPADAPESSDDGSTLAVRYSRQEVLSHKDFAALDDNERADVYRLMAAMRLLVSRRRSRRLRRDPHGRGRLDLRRTVRASLGTGGEVVRPATRRPGDRPRRLVLLLDVSGSMEPYARALLRFLHASVAGGRDVEAFAVGTRLTRLTRELSTHDPDTALARAGAVVDDWSGGTRLGEGIGRFCDEWGVRGFARGAIVVILSDGWDRGDPEHLAAQMARLRLVAHRIVWVNPLKASDGYSPLARGMAAALPYVDEFVEGHSLASLEDLAGVMSR